MQNDAADDLDVKRLHPQNAPRSLAADRKRLRQDVVERLARGKLFLKLSGHCAQRGIVHRRIFFLKRQHALCQRADALEFFI